MANRRRSVVRAGRALLQRPQFRSDLPGLFDGLPALGGANFRINVNTGDAIDFANTQLADNFSYGPGFTLRNHGTPPADQLNWNHQELDGRRPTFQHEPCRLARYLAVQQQSFVRAIVIHSDTERNKRLYRNPVTAARSRSILKCFTATASTPRPASSSVIRTAASRTTS